jgi:hypothetical protein
VKVRRAHLRPWLGIWLKIYSRSMSENNEPHCCCAVEVFNNFEPPIPRNGSYVESKMLLHLRNQADKPCILSEIWCC